MKNGEKFPAPLVASVDGSLILVDGFHRCAAMEALGEDCGDIELVECATLEEAIWLGFNANLRHGQPLKARLLRSAFKAYVKAHRHLRGTRDFKSYREIAAELPGVSYSTARRWMEKDFPSVFLAMGEIGGKAPGGLRGGGNIETALMREALALLNDAEAVMGGVADPGLRGRVAERAEALRLMMTHREGEMQWEDLQAFAGG